MYEDTARSALLRMARALGVSEEVFYGDTQPSVMSPEVMQAAGTIRLLRAFERITDPEVGAECVAFIEAAAARTTPA